jgi:spore coat polysaccharide biosynthesis predicted glycosyltransferase SpsG/CTP:molybdopterin cytidylyltransferase MocA
VPRKNLRTVGGVPLVARAVLAARNARGVGHVVVSTEDPEVAAVARGYGAEVVDRPPALASDAATVRQVVMHAVAALGWTGAVVVLQPTSPFTDPDLVDACLDRLEQHDSVATVAAVHHRLWGRRGPLVEAEDVNRQFSRPGAWVETGAVRAMRTCPFAGTLNELVGPDHLLFDPEDEMPNLPEAQYRRYALDVDHPEDFHAARDLATRGRVHFVITAGSTTGSGHLHRALTLADELAHHRVTFSCRGEQAEWALDAIEARGYAMSAGISTVPELVVFDCLDFVGRRDVLAAQADGSRVAVFEALDPEVLTAADLSVNALYAGTAAHLSGPAWEPLRPEFAVPAAPPEREARDIGRVLLTFGGVDPARLTERVSLWSGWGDVRALLPPGRPDAELAPGVQPFHGSVSEAMRWADLVVTSAGRTVLEAAALCRPVVALCANSREERHAPVPGVMWLGHHAQVEDDLIFRAVAHLLDDPQEARERAQEARGAVNPTGAAVSLGSMLDALVRG